MDSEFWESGRQVSSASRRLTLGVVFACACAPAACGEDDRAASSDPLDNPSSITILYPADDFGPSAPIQYLMFLTLMERGEDGELRGQLARRWSLDDERREWTVHLRTDVRWHDGVPVTARDVKFTLDLYPAALWVAPGTYETAVVDDSTYTIRYPADLRNPELPIGTPLDWYYPIYPEHLLRNEDPEAFEDWSFWETPVGNGPYRFVRRVDRTALFLEANPDYHLGPPAVATLTIKDGEASLVELISGNVDALSAVPDADIPKLRDDDRLRLYYGYNPSSISAVIWNHLHEPFGDPEIRRALTLAIDRFSILEFLNAPDGLRPFDVLFTTSQFVHDELPPGLEFDPEAARGILERLGWKDSDGDGIREKDGTPFRFSLLVAPSGGAWFPDHQREAVIVQSNLREVGVQVDIAPVESSIAWQRTSEGDFEAALFDIKESNRWLIFGSQSVIGYDNPVLASLEAKSRTTLYPDDLDRLYADAWDTFRADLPVTFLQPMVSWTAAHRRLRGLVSPWRADPGWHMGSLWIEDDPE